MTNEEAIEFLNKYKKNCVIQASNTTDINFLNTCILVIESLTLSIKALERVETFEKVEICEELSDPEVKQSCIEGPCKCSRPRGHWQVIGYHADKYFYCKCSNCQKKTKVFYDKTNPGEFGSLADIRRNVNFCMFCGADMREAREDET